MMTRLTGIPLAIEIWQYIYVYVFVRLYINSSSEAIVNEPSSEILEHLIHVSRYYNASASYSLRLIGNEVDNMLHYPNHYHIH